MHHLPPHALSGFLLANSSTYRWSIGLPAWLIDVLIQKQAESWPITLIVGLAMLSPEYEREYCAKKMSVPTPDEWQGYLDPVGLLLSVAFPCDRGPETFFDTTEYSRLSSAAKEKLCGFIRAEEEWARSQFQPNHLMNANQWMGSIYRRIMKMDPTSAYALGASIAHDTFCLHSAFVRSFLLRKA